MCCLSGNDNNSTTSTSNSSNSTRNKELLPVDFEPDDYSVICGRGKVYSNSPGNIRLQNIVGLFVSAYSQATTKCKKSEIVSLILHRAKQQQQGVRRNSENLFVKYEQNRWWVVSDNVAREKIGGLLRERLSSQYKSSSKAKMIAKKRQSIKAIESALRGYDSNDITNITTATMFFDKYQDQDLMNSKTTPASASCFGQEIYPQNAISGSSHQHNLSPKMIDDPIDSPFIMDRVQCDVISSSNLVEESPLVGRHGWSTLPQLQHHSSTSKLPLSFTSFPSEGHQDDNGAWLFVNGNNGSCLTSHPHNDYLECRSSSCSSSISNCSPSSSPTGEEGGTSNSSSNEKLLFEQLEKACDKITEALLLERKRQQGTLHSFFNDNNLVSIPTTCTRTTSDTSSSSCPTATAVATPDTDIDLMMIPSNFDPTTIFG